MATEVELKIIANGTQAAAEINKVNTALKGTEAQSDKTTAATKKQAQATGSLTDNWKKAAAQMAGVVAAGYAIKRVFDDVINSTVNYAKEVRQLSAISGESAENTSRFLQVLDDYQISAQDATTATRAMTQQGLAPNLETLAKLSDQYLALNTTEEKNAFILKNLGRAGLQWVDVLKQGSTAILAQSAAVNKNLILDQQAINKAREYELATDNLADAKLGLSVAIGTKVLPYYVKDLELLASLINGEKSYIDIVKENIKYVFQHGDAIDNQSRAYTEMARQAEAAKAAEAGLQQTTEELTKAYQAQSGVVDQLTTAYKNGAKEGVDALHQIAIAQLESKATTQDQFDAIDQLKVAWGLASAETLGDAKAIEYMTQQVIAGKMSIEELQRAIDKMHGKDIFINVFIQGGGAGQIDQRRVQRPGAPTQMQASGGPLGDATIVGEAGPEAIIGGWVYNASQTREMMRSGKLGVPRHFASGGLGWGDDPLTIGGNPANAAYNQRWYAAQTGGGGGGGGGTSNPTAAVTQAAVSASHAAQASSAASQTMAIVQQQQMVQSAVQNDNLITEIRQLRRDIPRAVRDAVQAVA